MASSQDNDGTVAPFAPAATTETATSGEQPSTPPRSLPLGPWRALRSQEAADPVPDAATFAAQPPEALGFHLRFEAGKALLALEQREAAPGVVVERALFEVPDVSFPLDVTGGAQRFIHKRLTLRAIEMSLSLATLFQPTALQRHGISLVRERVRSGAIEVLLDLPSTKGHSAIRARLSFFPVGMAGLAVVVDDIISFGALTRSRLDIALGLLDGTALPGAAAPHAMVRRAEPIRAALTQLLPGHGWKVPALGEVQLHDVLLSKQSLILRGWAREAPEGWKPKKGPPTPALIEAVDLAVFADNLAQHDDIAARLRVVDELLDHDHAALPPVIVPFVVDVLRQDSRRRFEAEDLARLHATSADARLATLSVHAEAVGLDARERAERLLALAHAADTADQPWVAARAFLVAADLWRDAGDEPRHVDAAASAYGSDPTLPESGMQYARALARGSDLDKALQVGRVALDRIDDPNTAEAFAVELAMVAQRHEGFDVARTFLRRALRRGDRVDALLALTQIEIDARVLPRAAEQLGRLLALLQREPLESALLRARVETLAARLARAQGEVALARLHLTQAKALLPADADIAVELSELLHDQAGGSVDEALEVLRDALLVDVPERAVVLRAAQLLLSRGEPQDAMRLRALVQRVGNSDAALMRVDAEAEACLGEPRALAALLSAEAETQPEQRCALQLRRCRLWLVAKQPDVTEAAAAFASALGADEGVATAAWPSLCAVAGAHLSRMTHALVSRLVERSPSLALISQLAEAATSIGQFDAAYALWRCRSEDAAVPHRAQAAAKAGLVAEEIEERERQQQLEQGHERARVALRLAELHMLPGGAGATVAAALYESAASEVAVDLLAWREAAVACHAAPHAARFLVAALPHAGDERELLLRFAPGLLADVATIAQAEGHSAVALTLRAHVAERDASLTAAEAYLQQARLRAAASPDDDADARALDVMGRLHHRADWVVAACERFVARGQTADQRRVLDLAFRDEVLAAQPALLEYGLRVALVTADASALWLMSRRVHEAAAFSLAEKRDAYRSVIERLIDVDNATAVEVARAALGLDPGFDVALAVTVPHALNNSACGEASSAMVLALQRGYSDERARLAQLTITSLHEQGLIDEELAVCSALLMVVLDFHQRRELLARVADLQAERGRAALAVEALEALVGIEPDPIERAGLLGRIADLEENSLSRPQLAIAALHARGLLLPDDDATSRRLLSLLGDVGDHEAVIAECERRALRLLQGPTCCEMWTLAGDAAQRLADATRAVAFWLRAVRTLPSSSVGLARLLDTARAQKNKRLAVRARLAAARALGDGAEAAERVADAGAYLAGVMGRPRLAAACFAYAERHDRTPAKHARVLVDVYRAMGDGAQALQAIDRVLAQTATEVWPDLLEAKADLQATLLGDVVAAEATRRDALELDPTLTLTSRALERSLRQRGDVAGAVEVAASRLEHNRTAVGGNARAPALLQLVREAASTGAHALARRLLERAAPWLVLEGAVVDANLELMRACDALGDAASALVAVQAARAGGPNPEQQLALAIDEARLLTQLGRSDEALALLNAAANAPELVGLTGRMALLLQLVAMEERRGGYLAAAQRLESQVLPLSPEDERAAVLERAALLFDDAADEDGTRRCLNAASSMAVLSRRAEFCRVRVYEQASQPHKAIAALSHLLAITHDDEPRATLLARLGTCYESEGMMPEALDAWRRRAAVLPHDVAAWCAIESLAQVCGDRDSHRTALTALVAWQVGGHTETRKRLLVLATLHQQQGELREAADLLLRARALDDLDELSATHGDANERERREALALYVRAGDDEAALQVLRQLGDAVTLRERALRASILARQGRPLDPAPWAKAILDDVLVCFTQADRTQPHAAQAEAQSAAGILGHVLDAAPHAFANALLAAALPPDGTADDIFREVFVGDRTEHYDVGAISALATKLPHVVVLHEATAQRYAAVEQFSAEAHAWAAAEAAARSDSRRTADVAKFQHAAARAALRAPSSETLLALWPSLVAALAATPAWRDEALVMLRDGEHWPQVAQLLEAALAHVDAAAERALRFELVWVLRAGIGDNAAATLHLEHLVNEDPDDRQAWGELFESLEAVNAQSLLADALGRRAVRAQGIELRELVRRQAQILSEIAPTQLPEQLELVREQYPADVELFELHRQIASRQGSLAHEAFLSHALDGDSASDVVVAAADAITHLPGAAPQEPLQQRAFRALLLRPDRVADVLARHLGVGAFGALAELLTSVPTDSATNAFAALQATIAAHNSSTLLGLYDAFMRHDVRAGLAIIQAPVLAIALRERGPAAALHTSREMGERIPSTTLQRFEARLLCRTQATAHHRALLTLAERQQRHLLQLNMGSARRSVSAAAFAVRASGVLPDAAATEAVAAATSHLRWSTYRSAALLCLAPQLRASGHERLERFWLSLRHLAPPLDGSAAATNAVQLQSWQAALASCVEGNDLTNLQLLGNVANAVAVMNEAVAPAQACALYARAHVGLVPLAEQGVAPATAFVVALRAAWLRAAVATDGVAVHAVAQAILDAHDLVNEASALEAARAYDRAPIVGALLEARLARAEGQPARHDAALALGEHLFAVGEAERAFELCLAEGAIDHAYSLAVRAPLPHRLREVVNDALAQAALFALADEPAEAEARLSASDDVASLRLRLELTQARQAPSCELAARVAINAAASTSDVVYAVELACAKDEAAIAIDVARHILARDGMAAGWLLETLLVHANSISSVQWASLVQALPEPRDASDVALVLRVLTHAALPLVVLRNSTAWRSQLDVSAAPLVLDAYASIQDDAAVERRDLMLAYIAIDGEAVRQALPHRDAIAFGALCLQRDDACVLTALFAASEPTAPMRAVVARAFLAVGDVSRAATLMQADAEGGADVRRPALEMLIETGASARVVDIFLERGFGADDVDLAERALAASTIGRRSAALAMRLADVTDADADVETAWRIAHVAGVAVVCALWRLRRAPADQRALSTLAHAADRSEATQQLARVLRQALAVHGRGEDEPEEGLTALRARRLTPTQARTWLLRRSPRANDAMLVQARSPDADRRAAWAGLAVATSSKDTATVLWRHARLPVSQAPMAVRMRLDDAMQSIDAQVPAWVAALGLGSTEARQALQALDAKGHVGPEVRRRLQPQRLVAAVDRHDVALGPVADALWRDDRFAANADERTTLASVLALRGQSDAAAVFDARVTSPLPPSAATLSAKADAARSAGAFAIAAGLVEMAIGIAGSTPARERDLRALAVGWPHVVERSLKRSLAHAQTPQEQQRLCVEQLAMLETRDNPRETLTAALRARSTFGQGLAPEHVLRAIAKAASQLEQPRVEESALSDLLLMPVTDGAALLLRRVELLCGALNTPQDALAALEQHDAFDRSAEMDAARGRVYTALSRFTEAALSFERAAGRVDGDQAVEWFKAAAHAYDACGLHDVAVEVLLRGVPDAGARDPAALALLREAETAARRDGGPSALAHVLKKKLALTEALELRRTLTTELAEILTDRLEEWQDALMVLSAHSAADAAAWEVHVELGDVYLHLQRPQEAVAAYQRAMLVPEIPREVLLSCARRARDAAKTSLDTNAFVSLSRFLLEMSPGAEGNEDPEALLAHVRAHGSPQELDALLAALAEHATEQGKAKLLYERWQLAHEVLLDAERAETLLFAVLDAEPAHAAALTKLQETAAWRTGTSDEGVSAVALVRRAEALLRAAPAVAAAPVDASTLAVTTAPEERAAELCLSAATLLRQAGAENGEVLAAIDAALGYAPRHASAFSAKAEVLQAQGDAESCWIFVDDADDISLVPVSFLLRVASDALQAGAIERATACAQFVRAHAQADDDQRQGALAILLEATAGTRDELLHLATAIDASSSLPDRLRLLQQKLVAHQRHDDEVGGLDCAKALLAQAPGDADAFAYVQSLSEQQRDPAMVLPYLHAFAETGIGDERASRFVTLGALLLQHRNDIAGAKDAYTQALAARPDNIDVRVKLVKLLLASGEWRDALVQLDRMTPAQWPDGEVELLWQCAQAAVALEDADAVIRLRRVLNAYPAHSEALRVLARSCQARGDVAGAEQALLQLVPLLERAGELKHLVDVQLELADMVGVEAAAALPHLEAAFAREPERSGLLRKVAIAQRAHAPARGVESYQRLIALADAAGDFAEQRRDDVFALADCLVRSGDDVAAVRVLMAEAARLDAAGVDAELVLGRAQALARTAGDEAKRLARLSPPPSVDARVTVRMSTSLLASASVAAATDLSSLVLPDLSDDVAPTPVVVEPPTAPSPAVPVDEAMAVYLREGNAQAAFLLGINALSDDALPLSGLSALRDASAAVSGGAQLVQVLQQKIETSPVALQVAFLRTLAQVQRTELGEIDRSANNLYRAHQLDAEDLDVRFELTEVYAQIPKLLPHAVTGTLQLLRRAPASARAFALARDIAARQRDAERERAMESVRAILAGETMPASERTVVHTVPSGGISQEVLASRVVPSGYAAPLGALLQLLSPHLELVLFGAAKLGADAQPLATDARAQALFARVEALLPGRPVRMVIADVPSPTVLAGSKTNCVVPRAMLAGSDALAVAAMARAYGMAQLGGVYADASRASDDKGMLLFLRQTWIDNKRTPHAEALLSRLSEAERAQAATFAAAAFAEGSEVNVRQTVLLMHRAVDRFCLVASGDVAATLTATHLPALLGAPPPMALAALVGNAEALELCAFAARENAWAIRRALGMDS